MPSPGKAETPRCVPVDNPRPGQRLQCAACYAMVDADKAWADLNGEAFKAYYHNGCRPDNFDVRPVARKESR